MQQDIIGQRIIWVDTTPSTNSSLALLAKEASCPEGCLLAAKNQTAGRGQAGNTWFFEPEKSLAFSLLLYPAFLSVSNAFYISKALSLGIAHALESAYSIPIEIKWPNDLFCSGKKLGGMLIENTIQGERLKQSITGIGLNINRTDFQDTLQATSLEQETNNYILPEDCLQKLIPFLNTYYTLLIMQQFKRIDEEYHRKLFLLNKAHTFITTHAFTGFIRKVDAEGLLHVEDESGYIQAFRLKEIRYA